MLRSLLLFVPVAAVILLVWHHLGQPVPLPPSPLAAGEKVNCVSYAPYHGSQSPFDRHVKITPEQVAGDLQRLSGLTSCIRTYSSVKGLRLITQLAPQYGLTVLQGVWLGRDLKSNRKEIESALDLAKLHPGTVKAFIVGNEVLLRGELSIAQIAAYLKEVHQRSGLPVSYADVWEFWLKAPELQSSVNFVTIHILPYWEDKPVPAANAVAHVKAIHDRVAEVFAGKDILIGEVGWPSRGRMREGALPSPSNQAMVLQGVVAAAKANGWKANLIEAYDQPWKKLLEGTVGGYWGLFDDRLHAKFEWGVPVSNHPHWRLEAALGLALAFAVFAAGVLGARGEDRRQPLGGSLAIAGVGLAGGLTFGWAVINFAIEGADLGDRLASGAMLLVAGLVPPIAAFALARGHRLDGLTLPLNPQTWRTTGRVPLLVSAAFAATLVLALYVALGLSFDPRYKDFPLAALTPPIVALAALVTFRGAPRVTPRIAERLAAAVLAVSALFIAVNEGVQNWQALWLAGLLVLLTLVALRAHRVQSS